MICAVIIGMESEDIINQVLSSYDKSLVLKDKQKECLVALIGGKTHVPDVTFSHAYAYEKVDPVR